MRGSAERLGVPFSEAEVRRVLETAAAEFESRPMRVRLLLNADDGPAAEAVPFARERPRPVRRLALAADAVDPEDLFLFHKTTRRETYERARAAHPEADDVILRTPGGFLTETTIANLVVRLGNRLVTPPVRDGLLGGVFREALLERGRVTEQSLTPEDLARAGGVWCVNALRGWMPAVVV
jgi:branched-subunit amino acid aminotransferase/4-amino-4-deoxychorismate lyase